VAFRVTDPVSSWGQTGTCLYLDVKMVRSKLVYLYVFENRLHLERF